MKPFQTNLRKLIFIAVAGFFVLGLTNTANAYTETVPIYSTDGGDNSRLVIHRGADFGTLIYLTFYIDGVQVTTLGRDQRYEAIVRPGRHLLAIGTSPSPYGKTRFTYRHVTMRRGHTYAFTALWVQPDYATLETGGTRNYLGVTR